MASESNTLLRAIRWRPNMNMYRGLKKYLVAYSQQKSYKADGELAKGNDLTFNHKLFQKLITIYSGSLILDDSKMENEIILVNMGDSYKTAFEDFVLAIHRSLNNPLVSTDARGGNQHFFFEGEEDGVKFKFTFSVKKLEDAWKGKSNRSLNEARRVLLSRAKENKRKVRWDIRKKEKAAAKVIEDAKKKLQEEAEQQQFELNNPNPTPQQIAEQKVKAAAAEKLKAEKAKAAAEKAFFDSGGVAGVGGQTLDQRLAEGAKGAVDLTGGYRKRSTSKRKRKTKRKKKTKRKRKRKRKRKTKRKTRRKA